MRWAKSLILAFFLVLMAVGGSMAVARRNLPATELTSAWDRVAVLRQDISLINLLNGLHLSREQMTQILHLARERRSLWEGAAPGSVELMAALRQAEEAFAVLKKEIQQGNPARGEVPARAASINQRLKELAQQNQKLVNQKQKALEGRLRRVLSPEQLKVVENFKPCLIPPLDLRNPVRAGQASAAAGVFKRLQRLRQIPEKHWRARRQQIAQRVVDRYSRHHYRMTEAEKQAEAARILRVMDRARQLSNIDFEMEKEKLAQELKPKDKMRELRDQLEARAPHGKKPRLSKVGRFLLNERIIPILKERLHTAPMASKS